MLILLEKWKNLFLNENSENIQFNAYVMFCFLFEACNKLFFLVMIGIGHIFDGNALFGY